VSPATPALTWRGAVSRSPYEPRRLTAIVLAACLSAVGGSGALARDTSPELAQPSASPEASAAPVAGASVRPEGTWTATAYDTWGDGLVEPLKGSRLTVSLLPAGRLEGQTGCGTYVGGYSVDGESIRLGVLSKGSEVCGRKRTEEAFAFSQALAAAATWAPGPSGLELLDERGLVRVVLERPSSGDVSGDWVVRSYARSNGKLTEPLPGTELTAGFDAGGSVAGSTGCRFFDARYVLEADRIVIAPIDRVGLSCEGDEQRQDRRYRRLLGDAVLWQRSGDRLTLSDGNGTPLIELEARLPLAEATEAPTDATGSAEPTLPPE